MESALALTAAVAGAFWIAGQAYALRCRLRAAERRAADLDTEVELLGREVERHAALLVRLNAAQVIEHRDATIDRLRLDRLDAERGRYGGIPWRSYPQTDPNAN